MNDRSEFHIFVTLTRSAGTADEPALLNINVFKGDGLRFEANFSSKLDANDALEDYYIYNDDDNEPEEVFEYSLFIFMLNEAPNKKLDDLHKQIIDVLN